MTIDKINKEIDINTLKKENSALKSKIEELRRENNSFLYSALSKFQGEMHIIPKDSKSFGNQTYASWEQLRKLTAPVLTKYGLSITQEPFSDENNTRKLRTTIAHSSGQKIVSEVHIPEYIPKESKDPKKDWGATLSFFKRHIYASVLGIAFD